MGFHTDASAVHRPGVIHAPGDYQALTGVSFTDPSNGSDPARCSCTLDRDRGGPDRAGRRREIGRMRAHKSRLAHMWHRDWGCHA
jgi:hypothetical protein